MSPNTHVKFKLNIEFMNSNIMGRRVSQYIQGLQCQTGEEQRYQRRSPTRTSHRINRYECASQHPKPCPALQKYKLQVSERVDEEKPRRGRRTEAARKSQHEKLVCINCCGYTWDDHTPKRISQKGARLPYLWSNNK